MTRFLIRPDRMRSAIATVALLELALAPGIAEAAPQPLKPGKYLCHTISVAARQQTAADVMAEENRRRTGNPVRPVQTPQIFLAPAAFGAIILDGQGGYTMPTLKKAGRYGFDKARGVPTFTGDLGAMRLMEYSGTGENFAIGVQGMNFQCSLPAAPPKAVSAGAKRPNPAFVSKVGPVLPSAGAGDFGGTFKGSYVCGTSEVPLQLDLQASPDGTLNGRFQFGGLHTPEISYFLGSFAMKGRWNGTHYVLKGDRWIKQPQGYTMIDIEGDLTTSGTAGVVLFSSCDSYAAERVDG